MNYTHTYILYLIYFVLLFFKYFPPKQFFKSILLNFTKITNFFPTQPIDLSLKVLKATLNIPSNPKSSHYLFYP